MGKSQRTKGHSFEREVAKRLRPVFSDDSIKRTPQYRQGHGAPDISTYLFAVECKVGQPASVNPWKAMDQVLPATQPGQYPLVVAKRDRNHTLACMRLEDFLDLVKAYVDLTKK